MSPPMNLHRLWGADCRRDGHLPMASVTRLQVTAYAKVKGKNQQRGYTKEDRVLSGQHPPTIQRQQVEAGEASSFH
jgi:hypothetical protein